MLFWSGLFSWLFWISLMVVGLSKNKPFSSRLRRETHFQLTVSFLLHHYTFSPRLTCWLAHLLYLFTGKEIASGSVTWPPCGGLSVKSTYQISHSWKKHTPPKEILGDDRCQSTKGGFTQGLKGRLSRWGNICYSKHTVIFDKCWVLVPGQLPGCEEWDGSSSALLITLKPLEMTGFSIISIFFVPLSDKSENNLMKKVR